MLSPGELPSKQSLIYRRHLRSVIVALHFESLRAKQSKHTARIDRRHEASLVIEPFSIAFFRDAVADKGQAGRTQGNQSTGVDGQIPKSLASKCRIRCSILHK